MFIVQQYSTDIAYRTEHKKTLKLGHDRQIETDRQQKLQLWNLIQTTTNTHSAPSEILSHCNTHSTHILFLLTQILCCNKSKPGLDMLQYVGDVCVDGMICWMLLVGSYRMWTADDNDRI